MCTHVLYPYACLAQKLSGFLLLFSFGRKRKEQNVFKKQNVSINPFMQNIIELINSL